MVKHGTQFHIPGFAFIASLDGEPVKAYSTLRNNIMLFFKNKFCQVLFRLYDSVFTMMQSCELLTSFNTCIINFLNPGISLIELIACNKTVMVLLYLWWMETTSTWSKTSYGAKMFADTCIPINKVIIACILQSTLNISK